MGQVLALATLRFRECVAGRLVWLVALVFAACVGVGLWATAPGEAARSAQADRAMLALVGSLAVLAAAVPAAMGFPGDVRTGAAQPLLTAPVSRLAVAVGEPLGYAAFAALLI